MNRIFYLIPIYLLLLIIPIISSCQKPSEFAVVHRIIDGDTIELANGEKVRYIGINTPEIHHLRKPVEYFGNEAAAFNSKIIKGKKVRLEFIHR